MFSPFETRLSHVYRWPITRTIKRQSVAEHSFRVALWADRIAKKYYGMNGNATVLYQITRMALLHDQMEAFTGDAPSSVKPVDWDQIVYDRFKNKIVEYYDDKNVIDVIYSILKVADMCEAMVFINEESAMGNTSMRALLEYVRGKLRLELNGRDDEQKMFRELLMDCERAAAFKQEALDD